MLALGVFQGLLNAIGWVLAQIYDLVGNYGLSIIVLTIVIKVVLLPLGVKQIKSMQAMQSIQPKVKELQKKFKGNKAKIQEETMKLYKEAGVNPLGGCLPLLLQFPILIAMYAVIRAPQLQPADTAGQVVASANATAYLVHNSHLPEDSALFKNVVLHQNLDFLGMNLQCSAAQSGTQATISDSSRNPVKPDKPILYSDGTALPFQATTGDGKLPCGSKTVDKIPYFALLLFMVATTFYQQRQMQQASPPGAASGQQQAILKLMPLMFGIFGFTFPAGLTLYWTVSNLWQIGQQYVLLRAGHIGPDAMERRIAENRAKSANNPEPAKLGFMARMQQRAEQSQQARSGQSPKKPPPKKPAGGQKPKPSGGSPSASGKGPQPKGRRPNTGGTPKPGRRPNTVLGNAVEAAMARETEKRAASVEEAVDAALHELGVSEQEARIDVLQEPRSGVLGIGSHEAVVRVRAIAPEVDPEDLEEQADTAADFLEELMGHMRIDAVAEPNLHHDHMYVDIVGDDEDDMALLIGRHGQTLDAIQELTRMVVGRRLDERVRVIVDVEDYRKRRETRLEEKARETAERVLRTGQEEALEPMNPFERKIVHDAVAEIDGVESSSRGEEPDRSVVIRRR